MKNTLAATALIALSFAFSSSLAAQSRNGQRTQAVMGNSSRTDLNSTLADLDRVSQATQVDIAGMNVNKWKSGWKSGFTKDGSHTEQAQQAANSLRRNLANAMPGLIHDVQNSRGSVSTTFKLYDDVSLVCEAVDSLINASEAVGHKSDAAPLLDDYTALTRVRRSLSNYIQQAASALETRGGKGSVSFVTPPPLYPTRQPAAVSSTFVTSTSSSTQIVDDQGVKKIIVDDTVPEKKTPAPSAGAATKKKAAVTVTNLE
ncbi:MAG TPA: hypothetical protein VKH81_03735 [Candidatus Angelobacter sp.]|nr:hypothetical protein [Candidatus Angelobacter sp.]